MRTRLILMLATLTILLIVLGCSSNNNNTDHASNNGNNNTEDNQVENNLNDEEESDEEKDIVTEKDLFESMLEEINQYSDQLLKDEGYALGIDIFGNYEQRSFIRNAGDDEVEIIMMETPVETEFEKDEEDYELPNGLKGTLGNVGKGYIDFVYYDDDMRTEIELGNMEIEDAKKKLDALDFRNKALTEKELKENLGFEFEDVSFFDNEGTNYDVSELWIKSRSLNTLEVRYRNPDAEEYDAIDVSVSAEEFEATGLEEPESVTTDKGKEVMIIDDGFFVEWLWEEDDGYFYRIAGNYDEEDVEKKEYNLEVIDNMTKEYGE